MTNPTVAETIAALKIAFDSPIASKKNIMLRKAADAIERLQAENDRLRKERDDFRETLDVMAKIDRSAFLKGKEQ